MRDLPAPYGPAMSGPQITRVTEITAWRGTEYLGVVPIRSGTLHVSSSGDVPGSLDLTVPSTRETRPGYPLHMLAASGQRLRVRRSLIVAGQHVARADHGWYRLLPVRPVAGMLQVRAESLEALIDTARFTAPTTYPAGSFAGLVQALCRGILPVRIADGVVGRATGSRTWEEDRLGALREVITAWGGVVGRVADDGVYEVSPSPAGITPVLTLHDGPDGTVQSVTPTGDGSLPANGVVAETSPDDGSTPLRETAIITAGPRAWGGPYGYVVRYFTSPLLTSRAACRSAALTTLTAEQRAASLWQIRAISDDRLERGDPIRITTRDVDMVARVEDIDLPLTPADEPGELMVSAISGTAYGQPVLGVM